MTQIGTIGDGAPESSIHKPLARVYAILLAFTGILLAPTELHAVDLVFSDVFPVAGGSFVTATCMAIDPAGNIYHAGSIGAATDIDPGPGVSTLPHVFLSDIYVAKFDAAGALQWAQAVGGMEDETAEAIAVDSAGNTYVAGTFENSVDFDPGPGVTTLTSPFGRNEVFILKLDPNGLFQWAGKINASGLDAIEGIAVDGAGDVYVAGQFGQTVDFDPGPGTFNLTAAGTSADGYVCKLDSSGTFIWARALGGTSNEVIFDIALDSAGNVHTTGYKFGSPDMDPGAGVTVLPGAGERDVFVHKMDSSGNFLWAVQFAGPGLELGRELAVDGPGNVYVTGDFRDTTDFDPGPGVFNLSSGGVDSFVCKLDANGSFLWAGATAPGGGSDDGRAIALDGAGGVYVAGFFLGAQDLDPGPGVYTVSPAGTKFNTYVWHLTTNGAIEWAGAYQSANTVFPYEILVDSAGQVFTLFNRTIDVDLDPSSRDYIVDTGNLQTHLIGKLEPQQLPIANADSGEVDADTVLTVLTSPPASSVLDNDTDGNARSVLAIEAFDAASALGASVTVNTDGTFIYDPTGVPALQALSIGDALTDSFTYTVSDGTDAVIGTVTIVVHGKGTGPGLPATKLWGLAGLVISVLLAGAWHSGHRDLRRA